MCLVPHGKNPPIYSLRSEKHSEKLNCLARLWSFCRKTVWTIHVDPKVQTPFRIITLITTTMRQKTETHCKALTPHKNIIWSKTLLWSRHKQCFLRKFKRAPCFSLNEWCKHTIWQTLESMNVWLKKCARSIAMTK